jgi:hypothetical protein
VQLEKFEKIVCSLPVWEAHQNLRTGKSQEVVKTFPAVKVKKVAG